MRDSLTAWQLRVPQLRADWDDLERAFSQSVSDLAALRIRAKDNGRVAGRLPAAGMPWFMTVFGRDTIVTGIQTMLLGPELARSALEELAELQATEDDPELDAEPGKIVHEVRRGKASETWFRAYYGTVDATPLYLVLLSEVWRWTDDTRLVTELREPAMRALEWIDRYGDRDGDGFVEYQKRSERGLDNQSWKDSHDSQRFADGRVAEPPIAPCEVQGYVFDAKQRTGRDRARGLARPRARRPARPGGEGAAGARSTRRTGWRSAAATTRSRSTATSGPSTPCARTWATCCGAASSLRAGRRGRRPADGRGAVVGVGRAHDVVRRTPRYNPLAYHNGTVWPHDNSLIALGPRALRALARGPADRAADVAGRRVLRPPAAGGVRGHAAGRDAVPDRVPDRRAAAGVGGGDAGAAAAACCSGSSRPRRRQTLETAAPVELPSWAGSLRLAGVPRFDRRWDVRVDNGHVKRRAGMKIAAHLHRCGSRCRRPATAGSSGSSGCSPTGSSTPATT